MTDIAATSVGTQLQANILALKLQLQRDAGVVALVEQAAKPAEPGTEPLASRSTGVDILV